MKLAFLILFIALLVGCKAKPLATDFMAAGSVASAQIQSDIDGAKYSWTNLERFVKKSGYQLWESLGYHLNNADMHADRLDVQLTMAGGQARKEHEDLMASRIVVQNLKDDFWSYRQRKYAARIITGFIVAWLALGATTILSGAFGFMGFARLIGANMPFMGPFVWLRDRIIRKKREADGTTNTTNITIQAPPAEVTVEAPADTHVESND